MINSGPDQPDGRHVPSDQPLLQPGHTYLLAITSAGSNQYTVIAGPESVVDLNGVDRAALIRQWTEAIATQQYPPGLPLTRIRSSRC